MESEKVLVTNTTESYIDDDVEPQGRDRDLAPVHAVSRGVLEVRPPKHFDEDECDKTDWAMGSGTSTCRRSSTSASS
jgi:hypothetical protein